MSGNPFRSNPNASSFNPNAPAFVPGVPFTPSQPPPAQQQEPTADCDADTPDPQVETAEPQVEREVERTNAEEPTAADQEPPEEAADELKHNAENAEPKAGTPVPTAEPKVKKAPVVDKNRLERVNMVFIGHVDAGKSTIGGQLMYLTGMVDKRTLEKYERYLSWAPDTNDEERKKGKTVEVGRAFFETDHRHFTILDAPGHKSFVPNMTSDATQADIAVLVIGARMSEYGKTIDRGGQTQEQEMLVKITGVKRLIILVNKMDDPTVGWSQERYTEIQTKLTPYLREIGFNPKNITGPCFLEFLDELPPMHRESHGPVRAIVADKYSNMGTMIIGKLESGVIEKGQTVLVMPNRTTCQAIQCWSDDVVVDQVCAGDNIKLKLKNIEESDILPGFVVCSPEAPCRVGRIFDAEVRILEHKSKIASGYRCNLHIHAAVKTIEVTRVICTIDKRTKEKKKARFVKQDESYILRMESSEPLCLELFNDLPQMGRFTLRDEGRKIAIGKVVKIVEKEEEKVVEQLTLLLSTEFAHIKEPQHVAIAAIEGFKEGKISGDVGKDLQKMFGKYMLTDLKQFTDIAFTFYRPYKRNCDMKTLHESFVKQKKEGSLGDGKQLLEEAERLKLKTKAPLLLVDVLLTKDVVKELKTYRTIFLRFTISDKRAQRYLLSGVRQLIMKHVSLLPRAPHVIKALYDHDLCEEEAIREWAAKVLSRYPKEELTRDIPAQCEQFVTWLKEAEEETESEDGAKSGEMAALLAGPHSPPPLDDVPEELEATVGGAGGSGSTGD